MKNKDYKKLSIAMILCGTFLLAMAVLTGWEKITYLTFHELGVSFTFFSFAFTPEVLTQNLFKKSDVEFTKTSKVLAFISGILFLAATIIGYVYRT